MTARQSQPSAGVGKKDLEFLVEEFLEKDGAFLAEKFKNQRDDPKAMVLRLDRILFKDEFCMDQLDEEDLEGTDFLKVIDNWHRSLKPIWTQVKQALMNFKEKVLPERTAPPYDQQAIPHELQGLHPYDPNQMDKYYPINLRSGSISRVTMCFDAGRIDIHNRDWKIQANFLDLIKGIPLSFFGRCKHCGNCIVITRSDKQHCPGCASSRWEKDKWNKDPDTAREKEKQRYREKRKKQKQQT